MTVRYNLFAILYDYRNLGTDSNNIELIIDELRKAGDKVYFDMRYLFGGTCVLES